MTPLSAGRHVAGARSALVAGSLLTAVAVLLGWWLALPGPAARAASGPGRYLLAMNDYYFTPSHMTWHVGEQVTLAFVNDSQAQPGKAHEFMMGRGPRQHPTMLGPSQEDGFVHDFFTGLTVWFGNAHGVDVLMPGMAHVTGAQAPKYFMKMPASQMSGGAAKDQMAGGGMKGKEMIMKGNGLMIDLVPGGTATIRFTVPDKPGTWTYGCFDQSGQHFLNGMHGTVNIVG